MPYPTTGPYFQTAVVDESATEVLEILGFNTLRANLEPVTGAFDRPSFLTYLQIEKENSTGSYGDGDGNDTSGGDVSGLGQEQDPDVGLFDA